MVTPSSTEIVLHFETLPRATKKALDFLASQKWLKESSWYLAGGTALALQAGQRRSVDLDFFFTTKKDCERGSFARIFWNARMGALLKQEKYDLWRVV
mgnify:CR=1 FL=1